MTCHSEKWRDINNEISAGWIPFNCLTFKGPGNVHADSLSLCKNLPRTLKQNVAITNAISKICAHLLVQMSALKNIYIYLTSLSLFSSRAEMKINHALYGSYSNQKKIVPLLWKMAGNIKYSLAKTYLVMVLWEGSEGNTRQSY